MSAQPEQCMLLRLPAEIRNAIYAYILVQPIRLSEAPLPMKPESGAVLPSSRRRFCANILRTCKRINEEATPMLYGENVFSAHYSLLTELPSLLIALHPNKIKARPVLHSGPLSKIRRFHIDVRLDTDPDFDRKKAQECFSGLEELEVVVSQSMYGGSDFSVLQLFEDVRGINKAVVRGSVGDGRYAAWLAQTMMLPVSAAVSPYIGSQEKALRWNSWSHGNR